MSMVRTCPIFPQLYRRPLQHPSKYFSFFFLLSENQNFIRPLTNAVDSAISGFITSKPIKSDCSCMSKLFDVMPPSTCTFCGGIPQSFFIASRMSRTWKHTASNDARRMCPRCVSSVMPQITLETFAFENIWQMHTIDRF